ncbi:MAG: SDR family oxidoreductase [Thermoleophilia bacterium]
MSSGTHPFNLEGKTALVTGASAGLGVEFVRALSAAGANVVLAARRVEPMQKLADELAAGGAGVLVHACDITDEAQVNATVEAAVAKFGGLHIAVANAGAVPEGLAVPEKMPADLFRQSIDINLTGTFITAAAAARHMLTHGGGSIIMLSSVAGVSGHHNIPIAYAAAKAATTHMAKYLAVVWADRGVRVNAIGPGWFPSEMTEAALAVPAFRARIEEQTPLGRLGNPSELIGALMLLASDAGSYITGQTLMVDGGMSASIGASPYPDELHGLTEAIMPHGLGSRLTPGA